MPDRPAITVALPTCQGARHLADALRGVLGQGGDFDLLVVDDRSTDDTLNVVAAECGDRARVLVNPERLGLAGNWDRCVEASRTPWVAVFHQDDLMLPGHLDAHRAAIAATPDAGFVCGGASVVDESGVEVSPAVVGRGGLGPSDRVFGPGELLPHLAVGNPIRCSTATLSRRAHAEAGGFDPSYRYAVDWGYWIKVARAHPVAWLAAETVAVRWHSASETHRFKCGTLDLEEQEGLMRRLVDELNGGRRMGADVDRRLSRAYLNRAYDAAGGADRRLRGRCLVRALRLWPGIVGRIVADPRLAARLLK